MAEGLNRTKRQRQHEFLFSLSLLELRYPSSLACWYQNLRFFSPQIPGLTLMAPHVVRPPAPLVLRLCSRLAVSHATNFPGSLVCSEHTVGLLSLQFLLLSSYLRIYLPYPLGSVSLENLNILPLQPHFLPATQSTAGYP